ncbi:uncharacterized protein FFB20_05814 [Fusarium fujikuroi]|nr:uncharacterized protein FFB20_05814 [Fusarium fujikuroi]SCN82314.1 uncharacterized protein FFC1_03838 [Fusarium fujikuroi]SCO18620.1 uncharacterized protein FFE2_14149 [Fusarium fujikuroi]SCV59372.1 uncharacterized protein FFFS_13941 [Fusarium fujikuroi]
MVFKENNSTNSLFILAVFTY